jgi:hypothetical protein
MLKGASLDERAAKTDLSPARLHWLTRDEIRRLTELSLTRRRGTHNQAVNAELELDAILGLHGVTLRECDEAVIARLDAAPDLGRYEPSRVAAACYDHALPVSPACAGCLGAQRYLREHPGMADLRPLPVAGLPSVGLA